MERKDIIEVKNKLDSHQLFKVSPFKEIIKRTKPHKDGAYFELIYLPEGAGFLWIYWSMLLGSIFLLTKGSGRWSVDQRLS